MIRFVDCLSTFLTKFDTIEEQALKGGWRDRVELATKFGIIYGNGRAEPEVRGGPAYMGEKIKYIGLSEASASTILLSAVQIEWSLWSRDVEAEIVPTCRELGIGIVAYSPLGQRFFSSGAKMAENLANDDLRRILHLSSLVDRTQETQNSLKVGAKLRLL
ncbi:hypothetical protein RHMOL_Rhmol02G0078400 [Rhododendron molle]|uniref:Uncharacterized protein n=1 Tax=Rhododendron molle TaxID=49168 RepID=A0ACC0PP40_RHOML|nr:hypothetical protein RHMOL_Rhmol02G0078400 [Rhododendron molle]